MIFGAGGNDVLSGQDGDDLLFGEAGNDRLLGGAGNDLLSGGLGIDQMQGQDGSDTYFVDETTDVVDEVGTGGRDKVISTATTFTLESGVEDIQLALGATQAAIGNSLNNVLSGNVGDTVAAGVADTLTGAGGADRLYGRNGVDVLSGGEGDDALYGGAGLDVMTGGLGDDVYYVDDAGDSADEAPAEGNDLVYSTALTFTLDDDVERMILQGVADIDATGGTSDNTIRGNAGANAISGGDGDDRLIGAGGDDVLTGGLVKDTIVSGAGADTIDYNAIADSAAGEALRDVINDFVSGTDVLDLTDIDLDGAGPGTAGFDEFIDGRAFSADATGQLRYADGVLSGSTNATAEAEFEIEFLNAAVVTESDLLLA